MHEKTAILPTALAHAQSRLYKHEHDSHTLDKCKKLKQFKTRCKDDMVNSDN